MVHLSTQSHRRNGSAAHLSWALSRKVDALINSKSDWRIGSPFLRFLFCLHSPFSTQSSHSQLKVIVRMKHRILTFLKRVWAALTFSHRFSFSTYQPIFIPILIIRKKHQPTFLERVCAALTFSHRSSFSTSRLDRSSLRRATWKKRKTISSNFNR